MTDWKPIETAPKYPEGAKPILVYGAKRLEWAVAVRDIDGSWLVETCSDRFNIYPPTHWMHLPEPPPPTNEREEGRGPRHRWRKSAVMLNGN
jgi:hypothetical protein